MGIRRITPWALALIAAVLALSAYHVGPESRPDLLDEFDAGFTAGLGLYDDWLQNNDQTHCNEMTIEKYGVSGWENWTPDEPQMFLIGCLQALQGERWTPSPRELGWMLEYPE